MIISMSNLGLISIEQLIALLAVNIVGLVGIGLIFWLMREKTPNPKTKLIMSVKMGLIMIILLAIVSGDLGISLWIESGNFQYVMIAIPLLICGSPFVFPVVVMGTYIQLIYRDKIQAYVDSHKR
jgi:hypothetical protein